MLKFDASIYSIVPWFIQPPGKYQQLDACSAREVRRGMARSNFHKICLAAEADLSLLRQLAIVTLARQSALRTIKSKIKREGRVKLGTLSQATLTRLANDWLRQHPELLAEAAASPIVAELIKREGQLS
jgi:hypothetical protein